MVDVLRVFCALFVGLIVGISGSCPDGTYGFQCGYRCNCPVTRCDTPDGCNLQPCSPGWSGPTCQKHNKALNKPTSASTAYLPAARAVNGDRGDAKYQLGFHSGFYDRTITYAWWRVDLGERTPIHDVTIYFRKDFKVRRNGIQIYIADTDASPTDGVNCYNVTGNRDGTDIPDVLNVTCSGEGQYLVLYTNTINNEGYDVPIMDFYEVEVDVCSPGTFGADCANYCNCDGDVCDYVSGVCPGGVCLPGWATETCDTVCDLGYYGANCSNDCLNRNCKGDNSSCDRETGECVGGCSAGWDGTDCTHKSHHKLLISAVVGGAAYLLLIIAVSAAAGVCWCTRKNRTGSNRLAHHSQGTPRANHNYENHGTSERSTEVEVDKLHDKIRELLEEAGGVHSEFHRLSVGANRPQLRSRRKGNRAKNRYKDLYPYDFNQVQLTKLHSDPLSTYINANYINGYFKPQAYIVT
ncbi:multiple epidermal growth factor-like domains protein 10 isoform X2 [Haliotis rufescens]|uniref:multiple epidermal growth factor-like domains protein 10 isoform X2 n=1 Tax=Haliotis rufescens TaxID=6454 RepID=UPI00201EAA42|nr:multiple epidermal growth factor-like domains protein 10 isoform X2 [Haliotis rufescens]XP_048256565.1 multiple epidermal growth factor-like domains protein 10 isoform X2 [Haliotis rufescens]